MENISDDRHRSIPRRFYEGMFADCLSLEQSPVFPADSVINFGEMIFKGCRHSVQEMGVWSVNHPGMKYEDYHDDIPYGVVELIQNKIKLPRRNKDNVRGREIDIRIDDDFQKGLGE